MSPEENKALVRRYFQEVWNKGNLYVADEVIGPDYGLCGQGGAMSGVEAVKLYISCYRAAFPNSRFTILSMTTEGDKVAVSWANHNTCCESRVASVVTGLSVYRVSKGRIVEGWVSSDQVGDMQKMGIIGQSRVP